MASNFLGKNWQYPSKSIFLHSYVYRVHNFHVFLQTSFSCIEEILSNFQVTIGTGCLRLHAYKLKYGGPLDCKQVQYILGSCLGGTLLGAVIIAVCYKRRNRLRLLTSGSPGVSHTLKVLLETNHEFRT